MALLKFMSPTAWPAEASPSPGGRIQYSQEGGGGGGLDWRKNLDKSWWHCCSSMVRTAWPAEASPSPGGRIQNSQGGGEGETGEENLEKY